MSQSTDSLRPYLSNEMSESSPASCRMTSELIAQAGSLVNLSQFQFQRRFYVEILRKIVFFGSQLPSKIWEQLKSFTILKRNYLQSFLEYPRVPWTHPFFESGASFQEKIRISLLQTTSSGVMAYHYLPSERGHSY